ncbi:TonB-dependent siderophore receptor [Rhizobium alvei]|uniref:TonB-dependent siderophore receptor n=1 Tax=Rhizobium alvei TaxID=1132659 RepID=A0ABT8YTM0_9HYPH|nr:TonB-dependent siderophore receptor [Rhizobium alvei]MDO6966699.1 TonB-dependent siderophore receptor [Rhizobium alvei]
MAAYGVPAIGIALLAGHAAAQDVTNLDRIVVEDDSETRPVGPDKTIVAKTSRLGTKTDTEIENIPAAVSVVTQKELETRAVKSVQQAVSYTAGVVTDEYGSDDRYDYYRIRGFDLTALGSYRDGLPARIPAWFTASRLEPYGLQRVEVLKGSTSSLFGLNAPGGLVNAITKRPQDIAGGEVYTTLGDSHIETGIDFGGPIDKDGVWKYRLTGLYQNGDYHYDFSNDDRLYIAPAVTISPDDGTSLTILGDYSKRNSTGAKGYPTGADIDLNTFVGEPDFNHFNTRQTDLGYQFEHQFDNGLTFRQNARYTHVRLDYEEVYGGTTNPSDPREAFAVYGNATRFSIDNQLQHEGSWGAFDSKLLVGIDYSHDNARENILYGSAPGIDLDNPVYCGRACITLGPYVNWHVKQDALGVYAQEQLTWNDRWLLTLGGRFDTVNTTADYIDSGTRDDNSADAFTKRLGLTYKATDEIAAYANYSESFQPLVAPTANGYTVEGSLKPQLGTQYEVGVKYKPEGYDALFTAALFDLSQTNVPESVSATVQRQVGEVNVRGLELEGKIALNESLNATVAYSYWHGKIVEDGNGGNIGNRPANVPKHIASAWLDYTIEGENSRGDITLGGGARYVGQRYSDSANTISMKSTMVFDIMAKYAITKDVDFQVNVTNLFDKKYQSTCYVSSCYYGDRRTVLGTLKYTW